MRIALYKTIVRPLYRGSYNLSFGYLKAYLQQHCPEVEVAVCENPDELLPLQPDLIGISSVTEMWEITKALLDDLRGAGFDGIIAVGGQHITALPETLPATADLAVLGEGEETLREIAEVLGRRGRAGLGEIRGIAYRQDGRLVITPPRPALDLDSLPEPADAPREHVNIYRTYWLSTARGCPYRCSHCVEWGFHQRVRLMSAERIFELMMKHYEETGDAHVRFLDDTVTASRERIFRLHRLMKERGMLGKFQIGSLSACAHHLTEDLVEALREMGTSDIGIGMESFSPRVLRLYKGDTVTLDHIRRAFEVCTRQGVTLRGVNLFGYPGETLEEMRETVRFGREHAGRSKLRLWGTSYYVCQPLPGSPLWHKALALGKVSPEMDFSTLRTAPGDPYDPGIFASRWYYGNEETVPRERFVAFLREEGYAVHDSPTKDEAAAPPLLRLPLTASDRAPIYERLAQQLGTEVAHHAQRMSRLGTQLADVRNAAQRSADRAAAAERALQQAGADREQQAAELQRRIEEISEQLTRVTHELEAHATALQRLRRNPLLRAASALKRVLRKAPRK